MAMPADLDPQVMWRAVVARDPRAEGRFVYAVVSTGVYCRPTCASRRPLRDRVRFFASPDDAERAGFRPCERCRPRDPSPRRDVVAAVEKACRVIASSDGCPRAGDLARAVGVSPSALGRAFRRVLGITAKEYAHAYRLGRLQALLRGAPTVTAAIYDAGFGSGSRVYERSVQLLGMTPAAYRAGAPGVRIRVALSPCPLGWIGVASSDKGICAIDLGDSKREVLDRLRARFPRAVLEPQDEALREHVRRVVRFIREPRDSLALPLDVRGTAFQRRVWRALQDVPVGATTTYGRLARKLGIPRGSRAVAQACGANPLAIAIPCHRVVREDGGLGGYRWGVEKKARLLAAERRAAVPRGKMRSG